MAQPHAPSPVKLLCGMISADVGLFGAAAERLANEFGPIDLTSDLMPFDLTHYYDEQMGSPLARRFVSFREPFAPDRLADAKLATQEIEARFAADAAPGRPPRPINLDPGYVAPAKLVLASLKDFSHRIYLGRGVYAEVTLMFRKGRWEPLPWTFPDFSSGRYDAFLTAVRDRLRSGDTVARGVAP